MATDRFGQPIITRNATGGTPFADNLRSRYGGGTPMLGNRFNVDFTHPSNSLRPGSPNRAGGGMSPWEQPIGGVNRTPPAAGSVSGGGGNMANPGSPVGGQASGLEGGDNIGINPGAAPTNRTATRPAPLPGTYGDYGAGTTMQPYQPPRRAMPDYGAGVSMTPFNNLTPRFDPTQDNPWGRGGNLNTGLHGLLAQLLGNRGGRY